MWMDLVVTLEPRSSSRSSASFSGQQIADTHVKPDGGRRSLIVDLPRIDESEREKSHGRALGVTADPIADGVGRRDPAFRRGEAPRIHQFRGDPGLGRDRVGRSVDPALVPEQVESTGTYDEPALAGDRGGRERLPKPAFSDG